MELPPLFQNFLICRPQSGGEGNANFDENIAPGRAFESGHPLTLEAEKAAIPRLRRDIHGESTFQRRNLDRGAKSCFPGSNGDLAMEIMPGDLEDWVKKKLDYQKEVSGRSARDPGSPLACDPHP